MKDRHDDIEKIFRDGLENFEADVDPSVWSSISSGINSGGAGSAASSAGTGAASTAGIVKIAAIVATTGILVTGGYFIFSGASEEKVAVQNEVVETDVVPEPISNENLSENPGTLPLKTNEKTEAGKVATNSNPAKQSAEVTGNDQAGSTESAEAGESGQETNGSGKNSESKTKITQSEVSNDKAENEKKYSAFEASIHASVKSGKQPLEVYFENRGTYSPDLKWRFGDGSESYQTNTSHTFEKSGNYWVILEIKGENGIRSKDSVRIIVEGKAYLNVPNVFSPNGDGLSDAFFIESEYIGSFSCEIFDRNGRPIFQWNNVNGHWDGRDMSGALMPPGTYFYVVKASDMDGNPMAIKKGSLALFR